MAKRTFIALSVGMCCLLAPFVGLSNPAVEANKPISQEEWATLPPCDESYAKLLPGQPALGLALYRFECPGLPPRLLSARRMVTLHSYTSSEDIERGATPHSSKVHQGPDFKVYRAGDRPISPIALDQLQARRSISAGEKLLAKDFEPKKLWAGGESIVIKVIQGNVTATLPGVALGVGRHGEAASAKADTGRIFTGIALTEESGPVLSVGSRPNRKDSP